MVHTGTDCAVLICSVDSPIPIDLSPPRHLCRSLFSSAGSSERTPFPCDTALPVWGTRKENDRRLIGPDTRHAVLQTVVALPAPPRGGAANSPRRPRPRLTIGAQPGQPKRQEDRSKREMQTETLNQAYYSTTSRPAPRVLLEGLKLAIVGSSRRSGSVYRNSATRTDRTYKTPLLSPPVARRAVFGTYIRSERRRRLPTNFLRNCPAHPEPTWDRMED